MNIDNLGFFSWVPNINPKTKKPAPPPKKLNTIVCDGKGGIEVQIGSDNGYQDQKCCVNCMKEHEKFHIEDVKNRNPNVCKDAEGNPLPKGTGIKAQGAPCALIPVPLGSGLPSASLQTFGFLFFTSSI